jgi:hypothetical protein
MNTYTFSDIFGAEFAALRAKRHRRFATWAEAQAGAGHLGFVVVLEVRTGAYQELDADSEEHAMNLARNWTLNGGIQSASVQRVAEDGSIRSLSVWHEGQRQ